MAQKTIVVASGYFSPIHGGHVEYLQKSKALGDILIVIVNNDEQEKNKKGKTFMRASERVKVVRALECVDIAIESMDTDRSVCKTLASLHPHIFTNGGDQFNDNIPEADTCNQYGITLVDGLGQKIQSSSVLIENAKNIPDYKGSDNGNNNNSLDGLIEPAKKIKVKPTKKIKKKTGKKIKKKKKQITIPNL